MIVARLALLFLLLAPAAGAAERTLEPAIAFAGIVRGTDERVRIVIDFDRPVEARLRWGRDPRRLVVSLPPTVFRLGDHFGADASGLLGRIGFDADGDGARILVELSAPVALAHEGVVAMGEGRHRLVLRLERANEAAFAALVAAAPIVPPRRAEAAEPSGKARIVIDAGHGGMDGGAKGRARTLEKDVTLAFARRFKAALEETGRFEVLMTREDDRFVPLSERLAMTKGSGARLFVSVHADSLRNRRIRGATVYTLSDVASDAVARGLATEQNRVDLAAGLELPTLDERAADILFDLMQRETRQVSRRVAGSITASLGKVTRLIGNPRRSADFFVLRAPDVPSLLLELGYLSNRDDEKLLRDGKWQEKVARALTGSLVEALDAGAPASP